MIYFDTNVAVYALCQNVDNSNQKEISMQLFRSVISDQELILSDVVLYEFAFISKKLDEDHNLIQDNLAFLSRYVKDSNIDVHRRVIELLEDTQLYKSSFDLHHLAFCEYYGSRLITFDKGFKKLQPFSKIEIDLR